MTHTIGEFTPDEIMSMYGNRIDAFLDAYAESSFTDTAKDWLLTMLAYMLGETEVNAYTDALMFPPEPKER